MIGCQEYRAYSPVLDMDVIRLSVADEKGGEFFALIPCTKQGKSLREAKAAALENIYEAIAIGLDPGEVRPL